MAMIRTKKRKEEGISLSDLVFSWSINDVLNKDLFKAQVNQIPNKFSTIGNYLNSFKIPLIEETRADFCCGLESLGQAPCCEISSVWMGERYKPPKALNYEISTKFILDLECHSRGLYKPESGDLLVFTSMIPSRIEDLIRPGAPLWLARVTVSSDERLSVGILSSQKIDFELFRKKRGKLFATYLMNLTTSMRIWVALNPDPKSSNMGLIENVLQYDPAVDDDCTLCLPRNVNDDGWNLLDYVGSLGLDESQKNAILSSIYMRNCSHQKHKVKLIWGPPGTGKTKTVSCLLFALLKLKCRTLTCAPTNTAILQVAKRLVNLFFDQSFELGTYGLGDIVLFGNKKRMKINDHDKLVDVFLEYRCEILERCFEPIGGWNHTLKSMISLLKNPQMLYNDYLIRAEKDKIDKEDSDKCDGKNEVGNDESKTVAPKEKGSKEGGVKQWKKLINQSLKENEKKYSEKGKKKEKTSSSIEQANDSPNKIEKLLTYEEFVIKKFYSLADILTSHANDLYTHLPTALLPLRVAKDMMKLFNLLNKSLKNPTMRFGNFALLMIKSEEILSKLNSLLEKFPGYKPEGSIWDVCLLNARLIFCTASSSVKVKSKMEMVIIDESAQLKECESAIPFQIPGLRNAILIGDDRQLPAMVRSKASDDADFGRSLFQRLATLGKKKHLLNIQYRMHPSISLFPNEAFYEKKIIDAPNVKQGSYSKTFLKEDMYGSYCFINVANGRERFDLGYSPRNMEEAIVVDRIIAKLFRGHCNTKQKISVGVISPYKGQIGLIQERLGKKYDTAKQEGFSVSVRSVDGFQGGEEDIIIISTVRCNGRGSVGFLSNHQRTNVALTRARYCLWIVGSGSTLTNSGSVWKDLVIDAKTRGCFYSSDDCISLPQVLTNQSYDKFDIDILKPRKARWKVLFTNSFKTSIASIKCSMIHKQVTEMVTKLADGWRQSKPENFKDASSYGATFDLLELYKVKKKLYLAWTVDILKEESQYIQVIKVWNVLLPLKVQELVKELNIMYGSYTMDFMNRCKQKLFDGNLVLPMSWPLQSPKTKCVIANNVDYLSGKLGAVSLKDTQGESSSGYSINNVTNKYKRGNSIISSWIRKETVDRCVGLTEVLRDL